MAIQNDKGGDGPTEFTTNPQPELTSLYVVGPASCHRQELPDSGELVIGRSQEAEIQIDDPAISRRHAMLYVGDRIQIEDLGSVNGSYLRGVRLEASKATDMFSGDILELGSWMVILRRSAGAERIRQILTHGYFEARLDGECARAGRSGSELIVCRLRTDGELSPGVLRSVLDRVLHKDEIVGEYSPFDYEFLILDSADDRLDRILETVRTELRRIGFEARTGLATYPGDGCTPEELIGQAGVDLRGQTIEETTSSALVIGDPAMAQLYRLVDRIAASNISVLILGETGVGKEVVARSVHEHSQRALKPFLGLNCAALTESLLESELFGYEKGAFTGAVADKQGLLESADGGTVFLDELGDLSLATQVKLLRVLEDRKVLRVGGRTDREIDVRFLAATNQNLEDAIAKGRFRQDLYYRVAGITISVPPLRSRKSEIHALAVGFIREFSEREGRPAAILSESALLTLRAYPWPGNVRELRNVIERAVLLCPGDEITPEHLPVEKPGYLASAPLADEPESVTNEISVNLPTEIATMPVRKSGATLKREIQDLEKDRIIKALEQHAGNQTRAAKALGIHRLTLIKRIEQYGLPRPRKRKK